MRHPLLVTAATAACIIVLAGCGSTGEPQETATRTVTGAPSVANDDTSASPAAPAASRSTDASPTETGVTSASLGVDLDAAVAGNPRLQLLAAFCTEDLPEVTDQVSAVLDEARGEGRLVMLEAGLLEAQDLVTEMIGQAGTDYPQLSTALYNYRDALDPHSTDGFDGILAGQDAAFEACRAEIDG